MNAFANSLLKTSMNMAISESHQLPFMDINRIAMIALILLIFVKIRSIHNLNNLPRTLIIALLQLIYLVTALYSLIRFSFVISYIVDQGLTKNKIQMCAALLLFIIGTNINLIELSVVTIIERVTLWLLKKYQMKDVHTSNLIALITLLIFTLGVAMFQIIFGEQELEYGTFNVSSAIFIFVFVFSIHRLLQTKSNYRFKGIVVCILFALYSLQNDTQFHNALIWPGLLILSFLQIIYYQDEDYELIVQDHNNNQVEDKWSSFITHLKQNRDARNLLIQLCLNFSFMFVELIYGFLSNSLGLISDSLHMLIDSSALAIALFASFMAKRKPNNTFTFGYERVEILSGYANGIFLLFAVVEIISESFERLITPQKVLPAKMMTVSILGLIVNLIGLYFFHNHGHMHSEDVDEQLEEEHQHHCNHHHDHNHNLSGVYLHILADALGSVACIISALLIYYYDIYIADPITSIIISLLILSTTYTLLKDTSRILLLYLPQSGKKILQQIDSEFKNNNLHPIERQLWQYKEKKFILTLKFDGDQVMRQSEIELILQKYTQIIVKSIDFNIEI